MSTKAAGGKNARGTRGDLNLPDHSWEETDPDAEIQVQKVPPSTETAAEGAETMATAEKTKTVKLNDTKGRSITVSPPAANMKKLSAVDKDGKTHEGLTVLGIYHYKGQEVPVVEVNGSPLPVVPYKGSDRITYWSPVGETPGVMPAQRAERGSKTSSSKGKVDTSIDPRLVGFLSAVAELSNFESLNALLSDDQTLNAILQANEVSASQVERHIKARSEKPAPRATQTSLLSKLFA